MLDYTRKHTTAGHIHFLIRTQTSFKVTPIVLHKIAISAVDRGSQNVPTSVGYNTDFRYLTKETKKGINNRPRQKEDIMQSTVLNICTIRTNRMHHLFSIYFNN